MTWKEYAFDENEIADRLSWGALIRPSVMECKDGSFLGVIEYQGYITKENCGISFGSLCGGWSIWSEAQHIGEGGMRNFLAVSWNPFKNDMGKIVNSILLTFSTSTPKDHFESILLEIANAISAVTTCHILSYQEIIDFLDFTLALGFQHTTMPDPPIDLDALLTNDLPIAFNEKGIEIFEKDVVIASFPAGMCEMERAAEKAFQSFTYRHVTRMLLLNHEEAKNEEDRYMARWCGGRFSLKRLIKKDIVSTINGYHREMFVFLIKREYRDEFCQSLRIFAKEAEIPFVLEDYNLKDVWWGSLPGMFRSDITPPVVGFLSLDALLYKTAE